MVAVELVLGATRVGLPAHKTIKLVVGPGRVGAAGLKAVEQVVVAGSGVVAAGKPTELVKAAGGVANAAFDAGKLVVDARGVGVAAAVAVEVVARPGGVEVAAVQAAEEVEAAGRVTDAALKAVELVVYARRVGLPALVADKNIAVGVLADIEPALRRDAHTYDCTYSRPGTGQRIGLQVQGLCGCVVAQVVAAGVEESPSWNCSRARVEPEAGLGPVGLVDEQGGGRGGDARALGRSQARHEQAFGRAANVERGRSIGRDGADAHALGMHPGGGRQQ